MNKQIVGKLSQFGKITVVKTAFIASMFFVSAPVVAAASDSTQAPGISSEINYLGAFNQDELLFRVKFDNQNGQPCHFIIKDQEGFVLFEQWFSGGNFTKKFLIQMENIANANLSFSFSSDNKTQRTETFQVAPGKEGQLVATRL